MCSETVDIDSRLIKSQETLLRVRELRAELDRVGSMKGFSLDLQRPIEELWTRRQSRQADYDSLLAENGPKIREFEQQEETIKNQYPGLHVFTVDDATALSNLARQYQSAIDEVGSLQRRRENELYKIAEQRIKLEDLEELRRVLSPLDAKDFEDAKSYNAVLGAAKDQEKECEKTVRSDKMVLSEINEQRQTVARSSRNKLGIAGALVVGLAGGLIASILQHFSVVFLVVFGAGVTIAAGAAAYFAVHAFQPEFYRLNEYKTTQDNIEKQAKLGEELKAKVVGLENRLETLARKASIADGQEFLAKVQEYAARGYILKDLASIDQSMYVCDTNGEKIKATIGEYFNRCGRSVEITSVSTLQLADEVSHYIAESKALNTNIAAINQARQQLDFLATEIKEADRQLQEIYVKAKLEHLHDIEAGYHEYYSKMASYHHWQSLSTELKRLETDMSSGFVPDELPPQIERLEKQRREKWKRIQQMAAMYTVISELGPPITPAPGLSTPATTVIPANPKLYLDEMKNERDLLTARVRSAATDDVSYQSMLKQLHATQTELNIVRRVKNALENAKERIFNAAPNEVWLNKLNAIMEDMLTEMGLELDNFQLTGGDDLEAARQMIGKPFSLKTVEQVRWFARIVVIKTLGLSALFPLVLNEPFGIFAEPMRPNNLAFLFELLQLGFQIIAITNNQSHYQAAFSALNEKQQGFLVPCTRIVVQT